MMNIPGLALQLERLPAPLPIWRGSAPANDWLAAANAVAAVKGRLVSLWASDHALTDGARQDPLGGSRQNPPGGIHDSPTGRTRVSAAYATQEGLLWLDLPLPEGHPSYPDLSAIFPFANRMQRATADLSGIFAADSLDQRPWLNHGAWPGHYAPLREQVPGHVSPSSRAVDDYAFVRVDGDGVHEIPVGPVHAGIIEPGHFRFSIVGEEVVRLEQRLGYTHKGIDKRFTELLPLDGHRLAGRVSGDSTVAYAWAYCMALESALACTPPERACWLRALMLERERVANHLGDLGTLGNDAALGFGLAQFSRLREDWSRLSKSAFGHRFMMDCIMPGGVAVDIDAAMVDQIVGQCDSVERDVHVLRTVYDEHPGLQDRFMSTGVVTPELAVRLGLTGLAGRASGQAMDLRCDQGWPPYDTLNAQLTTQVGGDVAARVVVRFDEIMESLRLIRAIARGLPAGPIQTVPHSSPEQAWGAGWVEGWRGEIFVALEIDGAANRILRCHCHDPSWQNWPALEHAVIGNIVPDFPLINKSFNLSYSGHDR